MHTALLSAASSTGSDFRVANLLIVIMVLLVAWPIFRKLRSSISENRKRRWVEDGLMDPPITGPGNGERPERP